MWTLLLPGLGSELCCYEMHLGGLDLVCLNVAKLIFVWFGLACLAFV